MLTFKQYINEKWRGVSDGTRTHDSVINGQKITTHFGGHGDKEPRKQGSYSVDFFVNSSTKNHKEVKDSKTQVKILHHVNKVVSHFIKKKNPKRLRMSGNSDKKRNLYAHAAERIAKRHGGTVSHDYEDRGHGDDHVTDTYIDFPKK